MRSDSRKGALVAAAAAVVLMLCAGSARAQGFNSLYPGFSSIVKPGRLTLIPYGGGYASDKYGALQEGFQLQQSVSPYISLVGRATGYQLWIGEGFDSPLSPGSGHSSRLNFGRFQGGFDLLLYPGTHLYLLGGYDAGDSHAPSLEGDVSSWLFAHTRHPINFSFSAIHNYESKVTSSAIDARMVMLSTQNYLWLGGLGGAVYGGGQIPNIQGQIGPDLGVYLRKWKVGVDAQAGYGYAHQYAQLSLYKSFSWSE
jgi:hypothetical protein